MLHLITLLGFAVALWLRPDTNGTTIAFLALLFLPYPGILGYSLIRKRLLTSPNYFCWFTVSWLPGYSVFASLVGVAGAKSPGLLVLGLFATQAYPILQSLRGYAARVRGRPRDTTGSIGRYTLSGLAARSLWSVPVVCIVLFSYRADPTGAGWTWEDVGAHGTFGAPVAISVGAIACIPFARARRWAMDWATKAGWSGRDHRWNRGREWFPRGKAANWLDVLETGIAAPIKEEIVYRGFFVFYIAQLSESAALGIGFGFVLFMCLHLYQGLSLLPSHLLFFTFVCALTFSPLGLWSAIGLHIAWNLKFAVDRSFRMRYLTRLPYARRYRQLASLPSEPAMSH